MAETGGQELLKGLACPLGCAQTPGRLRVGCSPESGAGLAPHSPLQGAL